MLIQFSCLQMRSSSNFRLDQWSTASPGRYQKMHAHTQTPNELLFYHSVLPMQPEKADIIDMIIRRALIQAIKCQCNCTFPFEFIRKGIFSCRNTATKVSYRSAIVGTNAYSASQLVNIIQQWVSSGPILEVEWWLLDVYADCPARISSLNDPECQNSEQVIGHPTMMTTDPALLLKCTQVTNNDK